MYTYLQDLHFVVIIYLQYVVFALFFMYSLCFVAVTQLHPQESIKLHLICTVAAKFVHSPSHFSRKQIVV